jgi:transcriptional regulator
MTYIPKQFKIDGPDRISSFLRQFSFATIVVAQNDQIDTVQVPMMISADHKTMSFHIAHGNPIKNIFATNPKVLVLFNGPHGYISPRWYSQPNVPTWNYTTVHVMGKITQSLLQDELFQDLKQLVSLYESQEFVEKMFVGDDLKMMAGQIQGIIGYKMDILDIQAKFKLSQNRDKESRENVVRELLSSSILSDRELGQFMKTFFETRPE